MSIELSGDLIAAKKQIEQLEDCLRKIWSKTEDEKLLFLIESRIPAKTIDDWRNKNG